MMSRTLVSSLCISIILALVSMIYFPRLAELPFRGEEPRRVVCAFEMWQSGNWVVPTIQGEVFLSRPPLQNWLIAFTAVVRGGFDHLSGRIPSVICVLLTALLIYYYCISLLSPRSSLLAALFFMTIPQVLQLGITAETELLFTFLLSSSFLLWHCAELRKWNHYIKWAVAYIFLALATLTKGINQAPIYFVAIIATYLFINRRLKELLSTAHATGFCVFIMIIAIWQVEFVHYIGAKKAWLMHLGDVELRFKDLAVKDYLLHSLIFPLELLAVLLPWSLFLLAYAIPQFWRHLLAPQAKPIAIFCIYALAITIFSVWYPPGARTRYYMPLFPCVAILAAIVAETLWFTTLYNGLSNPLLKRICPYLMQSMLFFIPLVAIINYIWTLFDIRFLQPSGSMIHAALYLMGCFLIVSCLFSLPKTENKFCYYILGYALFAGLTLNIIYTDTRKEKLNDLQSQVISVLKRLPQDINLVSLGTIPFDFLYYYMIHTGKTIAIVSELELKALKSPVFFCTLLTESSFQLYKSEQIKKIKTGRYKEKYSHDAMEELVIAKLN